MKGRRLAEKVFSAGITGLVILAAAAWLYGIRTYVVKSGSMEPAIEVGALCFENRRVPYEEIRSGDVVTFLVKDSLVAHRVVAAAPEGLITKGDANDYADGISVTKDNYHGRVLFSVPRAGYLIAWFGSARGRILGITAMAVILVLQMLADTLKEERRVLVERSGEER